MLSFMHPVMNAALVLSAATPVPTPTDSGSSLVSTVVTAIISTGVIAAVITALFQFLINRRNARIQERKNTVEAESDIVNRYKDAAAEERAQKESAVKTIRDLLAIAEQHIESLKDTIEHLNKTLEVMTASAKVQQSVIDQLTMDRDRVQHALEIAESQVSDQREKLLASQREILELTYPKGLVDQMKADNPQQS